MNVGIVARGNPETLRGTIASNGKMQPFRYAEGRTIISSEGQLEPTFGRHVQPDGFELKAPRVGDAVVFAVTDTAVEWAYAEHYLSAVFRNTPSDFVDLELIANHETV